MLYDQPNFGENRQYLGKEVSRGIVSERLLDNVVHHELPVVPDRHESRQLLQGSGFRVQGSGCRVQGAGRRVQGSGVRVRVTPALVRTAREKHSLLITRLA